MRLREELDADPTPIGAPGRFGEALRAFGDDADEFLELLADPSVPIASLWRLVKSRGVDVVETTVRYWVRKRRPNA